MPRYLSVSFQYSRRKLTDHTVRAFCDTLLRGGLSFAGGVLSSEGDSYDEIIHWNQQKLEQNFQLGHTEHYAHDYKQMYLQYADFSEVRLCIFNQRKEACFSFELLFLEDDLFADDPVHTWALRMNQFTKIEKLAAYMWENEAMECIQAGWEYAEEPVLYEDITAGVRPLIDPFCILPKSIIRREWQVEYLDVGRNGAYIRDIGWFHTAE